MVNSNKKGYSDISQKLFFNILEKLDIDKTEVFFEKNNGEFEVINFASSVYRLDFYIPKLKKWIEFDGDYWHRKKAEIEKRDIKRENRIKELIPNIKLKRIKESDFKADPEKIVNECVNWINNE